MSFLLRKELKQLDDALDRNRVIKNLHQSKKRRAIKQARVLAGSKLGLTSAFVAGLLKGLVSDEQSQSAVTGAKKMGGAGVRAIISSQLGA